MRMVRLIARAGIALALASATAQAQSPEDFYKSQRVTILIGHPAGGSYDFYARLASEFLKKQLPAGAPQIIVESKPGGGGVVAANQFYATSPRDGSAMALFPETIALTQLLEPAVGKWKVQEFSYVGSFAPVNTAFMRRKEAAAKTPDEMKQKETVVGCSGVNSQSFQYPAILKNLGGFKFKMICGYPGSAEYVLAMQKGEVDLVSSAWNNWRATNITEIKSGDLVPVIQGGLKRNRELPNVPLMHELVSDPEAKKVIEFVVAGAAIGRALLLPPGVPADRVNYLRGAFDRMVKDPELIAAAEKRGLELDPTPGIEVQKISDAIITSPKALVDAAAKAMQ